MMRFLILITEIENLKISYMKLRKLLKCIADVLVVAARDYLFKLYRNIFLSDRLQVTQFGGPEIRMCKKIEKQFL